MNAQTLLQQSEQVLRDHRINSTKSVGNRPHYPMFVAVGGNENRKMWESIHVVLEGVWPTTVNYVSSFLYDINSTGEVSFARADGVTADRNQISTSLDSIRRTKNVFCDMIPWYLYNIIDTTRFQSVTDLDAYYKSISIFQNIVSDTSRTMLIVLMDYATDKKALCQEMLSYLAGNTDYDSTIIFATRDRAGRMYSMSELYRLAADVVLFSNNDAISESDDEEYKARVEMLYSKSILTASYFVKTPPHEAISKQVTSIIAKSIERELSIQESYGLTDWAKNLGFQKNRSDICEKFISEANIEVPVEALEWFPVRSTKQFNINNITYQDFKNNTFDDVLDNFISNYLKAVSASINYETCIEELRKRIIGAFPINAFCDLTPSFVDGLMGQLIITNANEQLPLKEYLQARLSNFLRVEVLYPEIKAMLLKMGEAAKTTKAMARKYCEKLEQYTDQVEVTDLGSIYQTSTSNYLSTNEGLLKLRMAIAAGNDFEQIGDGIFECFTGAVAYNENLYSLSFTDEWARRLDLAGTAVYKEIGTELVADHSKRILLPDVSTIRTQMKIYALHTVDSKGENPTNLYSYLQDAFSADPLVQYFNTGRDDCLEAFVFVSCTRERLIRHD